MPPRPLRQPAPARLVISVLVGSDQALWPDLKERLQVCFGPLDSEYGPVPFAWTDYYDAELGDPPLSRYVLAFAGLVEQDTLADIKHVCLDLERKYRRQDGRRRFNVDPGLLTYDRLVLASMKNYTHRIYLGRGIFADLTLIYRKGHWHALDWTYPGYADKDMLAHVACLREKYAAEITRHHLGPYPLADNGYAQDPACPDSDRRP